MSNMRSNLPLSRSSMGVGIRVTGRLACLNLLKYQLEYCWRTLLIIDRLNECTGNCHEVIRVLHEIDQEKGRDYRNVF